MLAKYHKGEMLGLTFRPRAKAIKVRKCAGAVMRRGIEYSLLREQISRLSRNSDEFSGVFCLKANCCGAALVFSLRCRTVSRQVVARKLVRRLVLPMATRIFLRCQAARFVPEPSSLRRQSARLSLFCRRFPKVPALAQGSLKHESGFARRGSSRLTFPKTSQRRTRALVGLDQFVTAD
jgi:hypothetical protein